MYTEPEVIKMLAKLAEIFSESYPTDRESVERFMRWVYSQYGYTYSPPCEKS